ncbi:MAG: hypothetical protein AB7Q81_24400 [Gammaproteobacteria bacterium]
MKLSKLFSVLVENMSEKGADRLGLLIGAATLIVALGWSLARLISALYPAGLP